MPNRSTSANRKGVLEVLIVEGRPDQAEVIRKCLEAPGRERIRVDFAHTVQEAVELLRARKYNCLLIADRLPDGRGLDIMDEADEHLLTTPVIALSAEEDPQAAVDYFRAGCADFFVKRDVLDADKLRRGVARAMARFHRRAMGTVIERRQLGDSVIKSQEGLIALARTDRLTGICNRAVFDDYFSSHHADAAGRRGRYALCMIDIDRFKLYNDRYGHQAGDEALRAVAQKLSSTLRENDFIARYGGEEIVVLLDEVDAENARIVAERLRGLIHDQNLPHEGNQPFGRVTVSVGVAAFDPDAGETTADLLSRADAALYEAKGSGRNSVVVALPTAYEKRRSA